MFDQGDFPELEVFQRLIERGAPSLRSELLGNVSVGALQLPLISVELGSTAADAPAVGFFGGVHGVERIGTQVLLAFLHALIERLRWDDTLAHILERLRLVFVPLVNPGGMLLQ